MCDLMRRFNEGAQLTIDRIMADYGVNRRTVNRDLVALKDLGLSLKPEQGADGRKLWRIPRSKRKLSVSFNLTDLAALLMGRRLFDFLRGTLLEESLQKVYEAIEGELEKRKDLLRSGEIERKLYLISEGPKLLEPGHVEILDAVLTALLDQKQLRAIYVNTRGEKRERLLDPLTLVAFRRGLYVVARDSGGEVIRTFALERFEDADWVRGSSFTWPKDYTPERHFESAFFIIPGEPEVVDLVFEPGSERFIGIRVFHDTQEMTRLEDGRVRLRLRVPINDELVFWVLSFGSHVTALGPPALVERLRGELAAAAARY
jgi:predicted DNA-binding transcriptional regulator YafY